MEGEKIEHMRYTWCPENASYFHDTYDTIEDCVESAKTEYYGSTGEFYGNDDRYSPVIKIGTVDDIDYDRLAKVCFDNLTDTVYEEMQQFAFGTDSEAECYCISGDAEESFRESIKENIKKHLFVAPNMRTNFFKRKYDLIFGRWVDEDEENALF